jgi:hypothetical protein
MAKKSDNVGSTPESQLLEYLKENKDDHFNFEESVDYKVSTGSLMLDVEIGGGIGPGVHRLVGQNNQGKTPESILILNNFLDTVDNSLGMYIKAEGRLSNENIERSTREFTTNAEEWSNKKIFVLETNIYETIVNLLRRLIRDNPQKIKYGIIFDSTDALILKTDLEKSAEEARKVAGPALISKKFLQNLNLAMTKFGHLVLMIGHATAEIKIDPYSKTLNRGGMYSGGSALQHFPNFIFEFQPRWPSDVILDNPNGKLNDGKSKSLGHFCRIVLRKSSLENKDREYKIPIKYGQKKQSAIWVELEIINMLLAWQMLSRKGAWFYLEQSILTHIRKINKDFEEKYQGIDKFRTALENDARVTKFLYERFTNVISLAKKLSNLDSESLKDVGGAESEDEIDCFSRDNSQPI